MSRKQRNARVVYSSDLGRICPNCGKPTAECVCAQKAMGGHSKKGGVVRVSRETKGRKGKGVTVVTGLPLPPGELEQLAKKLKAKCGAGGTIKDGVIEIQGEQRDAVVRALEQEGFAAKRAGG